MVGSAHVPSVIHKSEENTFTGREAVFLGEGDTVSTPRSKRDPAHTMYDDPKSSDVWLTCSNSHKYMVPLKTYEIQDSSNPGISTNPVTFLLFGWWELLYGLVFGQAAFAGEKARLRKDKEEILPQYPNSQICPHCYTVTKKL